MTEQVLFSLPLERLEPIFKGWMRDVIKAETPEPQQPEKEFLTIREVASMLNISVPTIYGYVYHKEIPHMKRSGRLYFDRAELTEWIRSGRRITASEIRRAASQSLDR